MFYYVVADKNHRPSQGEQVEHTCPGSEIPVPVPVPTSQIPDTRSLVAHTHQNHITKAPRQPLLLSTLPSAVGPQVKSSQEVSEGIFVLYKPAPLIKVPTKEGH